MISLSSTDRLWLRVFSLMNNILNYLLSYISVTRLFVNRGHFFPTLLDTAPAKLSTILLKIDRGKWSTFNDIYYIQRSTYPFRALENTHQVFILQFSKQFCEIDCLFAVFRFLPWRCQFLSTYEFECHLGIFPFFLIHVFPYTYSRQVHVYIYEYEPCYTAELLCASSRSNNPEEGILPHPDPLF